MSKNNQTGVSEADHYRRFEALPPAFRRALRHCSHDMTVGWVELAIAIEGEAEALKTVRRQLARMRRQTILEHYGPNHPQMETRA